jgi:hypothetical protein
MLKSTTPTWRCPTSRRRKSLFRPDQFLTTNAPGRERLHQLLTQMHLSD